MSVKLLVNKLELNNKKWFRKLVRWLGGKLVPNFSVEELVVVVSDDVTGDNNVYHLIGEEFDEYVVVDNSTISKYSVDEYGKLVKVLYKNVNMCGISCNSRAFKIDNIRFTKDSFSVDGNSVSELLLDTFENEVEEYLDFGNVVITGIDGKYNVSVTYVSTDEDKYKSLKEKFYDMLHA